VTYIIAEMSANHNGSYHRALDIIRAAKDSGADAVKIQLYTPDTLTIDCKRDDFVISGSPWGGETLYNLYRRAHMPWGWVDGLCGEALKVGIEIFPTVYDKSSLEFAEGFGFERYKISSFEIVDIPLLKEVRKAGKPVILSTGGASDGEIRDAINALGGKDITLLKCTSAYPAPADRMDLWGIQRLIRQYLLPVGLSDHSFGITAPILSVALGASVIEKHFALDRDGVDGMFSLTPGEFKTMVYSVREAEDMVKECPAATPTAQFRKSIYAISDIKAGEFLGPSNIRVIRPGYGLPPKHWEDLMGVVAKCDIKRGTALTWEMVR
jgi:pseudaminic acid synthase